MLLDELVGVIETLKERIGRHRSTLQGNETRTRMALIDPLLTALGWDTSDPSLVTPEYIVGEGRADYALGVSETIPAAIVEAKRLGHSLSDEERMQMLNYANARGVRYAAVTDGDVWEFYEVFKHVPLEDRRLLSRRVANTPAHELALRLLLLWRPNLASGQPATASAPLLDWTTVPQPAVTVGPETPLATETPHPISFETTTIEPGWVSLPKYDPPNGTKPPQSIRFPDGRERKVKHWNDILVEVAAWLHSSGRLTAHDLPVSSSPISYIVHSQPKHPRGNDFYRHKTIADGQIWVATWVSASQSRNNSKTLLLHCGADPADVLLRLE